MALKAGSVIELTQVEGELVRLAWSGLARNRAALQAQMAEVTNEFERSVAPVREAHGLKDGVLVSAEERDGKVVLVVVADPEDQSRPVRRRAAKAKK